MKYDLASEIKHLIVILLGSFLLGWLLDAIPTFLIIALGGYTAWNLRQLYRLQTWLKNIDPVDPPISHGLWGAVFDEIYQLQQRQLKYRARLKRVIKRFRDSTFALKDGFVMLDLEGNIEWWNPAAERLLGLITPSDINQLITNLVRNPAFKSYFDQRDYEKPLEIPAPHNDKLTLHYQITHFGKEERLIIVRDVTELRRLERMRSDFVANISHELSTPLTVVKGYLETMADHQQQLPSIWQRALEQMQQQTERMKMLLADLLVLTKLESAGRKTEPKAVDMKALITQVTEDLQPLLAERKQPLRLSCSASQQLLGYREELYSLISNLVSNASKYAPPESPIEVSWLDEAPGAILKVKDYGPGIADKDKPRLTERFYRADKSRNSATGGTGLGLAIVKHILIHHQAELEIDSALGKGASFNCHFPRQSLVPHNATQEEQLLGSAD